MRNTLLLFSLFVILVTSCTYVQKVSDGPTAYDRKQYDVAVPMLKKEFKREKQRTEKGKIAFYIAESLKKTGQESESIDLYKTAYDNAYGVDALKGYAYALKTTEQYKDAKQAFKDLSIEIGSPYEYRREIKICEKASQWINRIDSTGITIQSLPINSIASDYSPSLFGENAIVFSSDRKESMGDQTYAWTGNDFSDLFIADLSTYEVEPMKTLNTPFNEGPSAFSKNKELIIFTRCSNDYKYEDVYCRLFQAEKDGDNWSSATPLLFQEEKINYMHPALSPDGSTLYYASDDPGGWGGFDIYYSERTPDGWAAPQLIGRTVNTEGNEKFPFVNETELYFSSDYQPGLGGLDIFKSKHTGLRGWSVAENLKAPINSGKDDFGIIIQSTDGSDTTLLEQGLFSSSRSGGLGSDDIYKFERRASIEPPVIEIPDTVEAAPIVYKILLEGFVLEKIYQFPDNPNSKVVGRRPIEGAQVDASAIQFSENFTSDENGYFSLELDASTDYNFAASKEGFFKNSAFFTTKGIGEDPENPVAKFEIEITLDKIFKNREINLSNIYYDYNKSFIREDAKPTLNELANTLNQNPNISIQLASHTDCRGNPSYNQSLSQKRAQAAVDYLISLGIDGNRLTAIGYGENALAVDDCQCTKCSEEAHQANRRTTFKVID